MASLSSYAETQQGDHLLRDGTFTKPSAIYLALFTTEPGIDGTGGVEVSAGGYVRVQCGPDDDNWAQDPIADANGRHPFVNQVDFTFGSPTEDWAADPDYIVAVGFFDAETGGNFIASESLIVPQEVFSGGLPPKFAAGDLKFTFS